LEVVKDKIEYEWVENLWQFKELDSYVIDKPFMFYLTFITEMLYYKDAEFRSSKSYESNFLDFKVLSTIYSQKNNLEFLIFSLDFIKQLESHRDPILWEGESLREILRQVLQNKRDTNQLFVLYHALAYSFQEESAENLYDYIRVVRNLIANTPDNSRREWPRLMSSLQSLITEMNVYEILAQDVDNLVGFNVEQRKEEIFKAKLIIDYPDFKKEIFKIEDDKYLAGHITNLLLAPFVLNETDFASDNLETTKYEVTKLAELANIYKCYKEFAKDDFRTVFGNLLISKIYYQTADSRLNCVGNYDTHPGMIMFAKQYAKSTNKNLEQFIISVQRDFINSMSTAYVDFTEIRNVKYQLYMYYIIGQRIYKDSYYDFFKNGNLNFGWLRKENGYKSHFSDGIDECPRFSIVNPIFQVYNQQFRYSLGLNPNNTISIEMIGGNKKRDAFRLIEEWASAEELATN
jgi:hypothetical protein